MFFESGPLSVGRFFIGARAGARATDLDLARVLPSQSCGCGVSAGMPNREHGTMKALRKMQAARGLSMEPAHVPAIGPTDVLVRVKAASICGTDLHIYGWDRWSQGRIKPPVTLGHEFC